MYPSIKSTRSFRQQDWPCIANKIATSLLLLAILASLVLHAVYAKSQPARISGIVCLVLITFVNVVQFAAGKGVRKSVGLSKNKAYIWIVAMLIFISYLAALILELSL